MLKKTITLGLLGLGIGGALFAQSNFKPGYVISLEGDTLYGQVDYRGNELMAKVCSFIPANEETAVKYLPGEIQAYRFTDGKYFVSRTIQARPLFLEYLINGELSVYYWRDNGMDRYFLDKNNAELVELPYELKMVKNDGKLYEMASNQHIGLLTLYTEDAPSLKSKINNINQPSHRNMVQLAKEYHDIVCEDGECIIYEQKKPSIKVDIELAVGLARFSEEADIVDKGYAMPGVMFHFYSPKVNEKIRFKTGLFRLQLETEKEKERYFKIPLHVEYLYPKGHVRPAFSYGINAYVPMVTSVSGNAGVYLMLSDHVSLMVAAETEFASSLLVLPRQYMGYSILGGLCIKL
jgi:hypothetical protein